MSGSSLSFSSTLKIEEEEVMVTKKQGIISILVGSDDENSNNNKKACSLRRTLSADMSSKKWLTQNVFNNSPSLKKTASSLQLIPVSINEYSSSSDEDTTPTRFDVWNSIQEEKQNNNDEGGKTEKKFDIWSSIVSSQKVEEGEKETPLYIHPLVKRSASSLSEKSLEICTESLGSETGSDGFSSYPSSETGSTDEDEQDEKVMVGQSATRNSVNYGIKKQEKKNNFPPPIPSLSLRGEDGGAAATLRMKSHRNNGRLVLEAVPVPQQNNNFKAQRQGGRLVLTFAGNDNKEEEYEPIIEEGQEPVIEEEFGQEFNNFEDDDIESEIDEETEETEFDKEMGCRYVFEDTPKSGIMNVHRLALMVNKPMALPNRNPTIWSNKFDVDQDQVKVKHATIAQSLPPRAPRLIPSQSPSTTKVAVVPVGAAVSFNAYEYYWRPEPMVEQSPMNDKDKKIISGDEKQKMVTLKKNKGDYLVPLSKGCKETRRSLLFWEPSCITTS